MLADTPEPPYYAVLFSSIRMEGDDGYGEMAARMDALTRVQPGFLGLEHARSPGPDGIGITLCYWTDLDAIAAWKRNLDHMAAQDAGYARWYAGFRLRVARVERASAWDR